MPVTLEVPVRIDHLSWSSISMYRSCPRQFQFRVLNVTPERSSATLVFGSAIHWAIELIHVARRDGKPWPTDEQLMSAFDASWAKGSTRTPELCFAKNQDATTLRALAERMLAAYRQSVNDDATVVGVEQEFRFELSPDMPSVVARLDLAEVKDGALVVTDFKTSRGAWNDSRLSESLPQLILYALASLPMLQKLGLTCVRPQFVVISKAKLSKVQTLTPNDVGRSDVERVRSMFADVWSCVQKGWFPRIESWRCRSGCPYRVLCLGY